MNGTTDARTCRRTLVACGVIIWLLCLAILALSHQFAAAVPNRQRPLLLVLSLFAVMFAAYVWALHAVLRDHETRGRWIVFFGILFRVTLLVSRPIQEVDIYRYIWDGNVSSRGISPFAFTPQQVLDAPAFGTRPDLATLAALRHSSPALDQVLNQVHFRELPTVYPPISQWVFKWAAMTTPNTADFDTHVAVMKAWLVAFDLLTVAIIWLLLRRLGQPPNGILAYCWCPLVLKEFANSGHLDSIAVFLTTLAVYLAIVSFGLGVERSGQIPRGGERSRRGYMQLKFIGACIALGLAVGAKLYPAALVPWFAWVGYQRRSLTTTAIGMTVLALTIATVMMPLLEPAALRPGGGDRPIDGADEDIDPFTMPIESGDADDPTRGLKVFLGHWKINDLIFLFVNENLTPDAMSQPCWFVVVPDTWRTSIVSATTTYFGVPLEQSPFVLARGITAAFFAGVAFFFAHRAAVPNQNVTVCLEAVFLTLAWLWLLSPTLNPWYWTWVLPFIPFARNRAWHAMSGLALLYYLRFFFESHWSDLGVWGTNYQGAAFYDFVMVWLIQLPWFLWLFGAWWQRRMKSSSHASGIG